MGKVLHGPRSVPHFPVMRLPYTMENQPKPKLCHLCFDVGDWFAHSFSLLAKHCCTFTIAIQHYRVVAFTDLPFTSPNQYSEASRWLQVAARVLVAAREESKP